MRSCLIIKNDGLGDLVLFMDFIKQLSMNYKIDLVTCIENKEVVELFDKYINRAFYISRDSLNIKKIDKNIEFIIPKYDEIILKEIENKNYDIAIVPRRFIRANSLVVMQFINAVNRYVCWLYPTNISEDDANILSSTWIHLKYDEKNFHEKQYYKLFLDEVFKTDLKIINKNFSKQKQNKKIGIGIDGKGWNLKSDNIHNWLFLIDKLISLDFEIYLFGKSNLASEIAYKLERRNQKIVNLVDRISLKQTIKTFKNMSFYIGNDTGLTHLACLYISKILVIHSGAGIGRFFPWPKAKNQYIIFKGMSCFDCSWNCKYTKYKCLEEISSLDVSNYFLSEVLIGNKNYICNTSENDIFRLDYSSGIDKGIFSISKSLKKVLKDQKIKKSKQHTLRNEEMKNSDELIKQNLEKFEIVKIKPTRRVEKLIDELEILSKNGDFTFKKRNVDIDRFVEYFKKIDYFSNYKMYCEQYHKSISRKIMEHFLSFEILDINKQNKDEYVFLDVACSTSPVQLILNSQYNFKEIYKQDLNLKVSIESKYKISSNATNIPLKNDFVDGITLHNSWEHFEGSDDVDFIKEAGRLLKKGGKFLILPLDLADETYILTSPSVWFDKYINLKDIPNFDENAKIFIDEDKKQRQEKSYSPKYIAKILSEYSDIFDFEILCYKNLLASNNELFNGNYEPYAIGANDNFSEFVLVGTKK